MKHTASFKAARTPAIQIIIHILVLAFFIHVYLKIVPKTTLLEDYSIIKLVKLRYMH